MSTTSPLSGVLSRVLASPAVGVAGLVDHLLLACKQHGLRLEWRTDSYRVSSAAGEVLEPPLRKSVFRAILARVAVLCNERQPNSVTPYGGEGELTVGADPAAVFLVEFVNTPAAQQLTLRPAPKPTDDTVWMQAEETTELNRRPADKSSAPPEAPPSARRPGDGVSEH